MRMHWMILITAMILLMSGCSQGQESILNEVEVNFYADQEIVPTGEKRTYTVELKDPKGNPFDADHVYLYMNMNMMNHPTEGTMKKVRPGTYELELPLAMAGEWYAHVTLTQGGVERKVEGFNQLAEGEKHIELMRGYHADQPK